MNRDGMEQLAADASDALAKGMTYGKYMAWKQQQGMAREIIPRRELVEGEAYCRYCRAIFRKSKHNKYYCSRACMQMRLYGKTYEY